MKPFPKWMQEDYRPTALKQRRFRKAFCAHHNAIYIRSRVQLIALAPSLGQPDQEDELCRTAGHVWSSYNSYCRVRKQSNA